MADAIADSGLAGPEPAPDRCEIGYDDVGLYSADCGGGIVYLDLAEDLYYCAYREEDRADYSNLSRRCRDQVNAADRPIRQSPWSAVPLGGRRPHLRDARRFAQALVESRSRFRGSSIWQMLHHVAARDRPIAPSPLAAQLAGYHALFVRMLPFPTGCLFNSFLLLNFLARYDVSAHWVFGAQLFPFRAHCWVAVGNTLLNERPHRIEDYQTVLAVDPSAWPII